MYPHRHKHSEEKKVMYSENAPPYPANEKHTGIKKIRSSYEEVVMLSVAYR